MSRDPGGRPAVKGGAKIRLVGGRGENSTSQDGCALKAKKLKVQANQQELLPGENPKQGSDRRTRTGRTVDRCKKKPPRQGGLEKKKVPFEETERPGPDEPGEERLKRGKPYCDPLLNLIGGFVATSKFLTPTQGRRHGKRERTWVKGRRLKKEFNQS